MVHGALVSDFGGQGQLDLGARTVLAPYAKVRAEGFRSLAHSLQSPVTGALSIAHHLRIHADAIVADSQYKHSFRIVQFGLDVSCLSMLSRVTQGFTSDAIDVVSNEWCDRPRFTFNQNPEGRHEQSVGRELFTQRRQS